MFKLEQTPSFWFKVPLTVPGVPVPVEIECEGKHFSATALQAFEKGVRTRTDLETCGEILLGWRHVDAPYSRDNLERLVEKCPRAGLDIHDAWLAEYFEARRKN